MAFQTLTGEEIGLECKLVNNKLLRATPMQHLAIVHIGVVSGGGGHVPPEKKQNIGIITGLICRHSGA
jgi:hypothetical protein